MEHGPDTHELFRRLQDGDQWLGKSVLIISGLRLTSLPPIPEHITLINCCGSRLTKLPPLPSGLITLVCSNTPITELPELPQGLGYLDCSNTNIVELPEIPESVKYLDCDGALIRFPRGFDEDIPSYRKRLNELRESRRRCVSRCNALKDDLVAEAMSPFRIGILYRNYGPDALRTFYVC
jgi:hypothetical protein